LQLPTLTGPPAASTARFSLSILMLRWAGSGKRLPSAANASMSGKC